MMRLLDNRMTKSPLICLNLRQKLLREEEKRVCDNSVFVVKMGSDG